MILSLDQDLSLAIKYPPTYLGESICRFSRRGRLRLSTNIFKGCVSGTRLWQIAIARAILMGWCSYITHQIVPLSLTEWLLILAMLAISLVEPMIFRTQSDDSGSRLNSTCTSKRENLSSSSDCGQRGKTAKL